MTRCNAIIEANNEIDRLKKENKKLNALCVEYGFEMGRLEEENDRLKQREERLLCEIEDFQELLAKNDDVCHKRVIDLIDDKIAFFYKAKADMINVDDDYRYGQIAFAIQCLRELRKELEE